MDSRAGLDSYARAYAEALSERASLPGDGDMAQAYELGRRAVAERVSLLDLASIHGEALVAALESGEPEDRERIAQLAADFLRESLSTFEITLRGYAEMREVARVEHEHVLKLQAIADTAIALEASETVPDILRVAAGRTREILQASAACARLSGGVAGGPAEAVAGDASLAGQRPALSVSLRGSHESETHGVLRVSDPDSSDPTCRAVLVQIAQLAAAALASAEALQTQREIADTLQRSLLPAALPEVEGLELAARFCPAGNGIVVGGDFYDAFVVDGSGTRGLVIGDVCGKGPAAAALTALVRHTLRTALLVQSTPVSVLGLVNAAIRHNAGDEPCTVLLGLLDSQPGGCGVCFATGGHPLPIVVPASGAVRAVGEPGMLLGVSDEPALSSFDVSLQRGDLLVLYTDGAIEVRGHGEELFGLDDLIGVLGSCRNAAAQEVADRVAEAALGAADGPARDDIAVLTMRVG